ncbi:MAG: hypothetical protein CMO55_06720 [Verrucomicrobiales bacterium]|nr:hypothetical protein [Verrucomicrobiales bacterium]
METEASQNETRRQSLIFRKGTDGETLFYPPFTPWRPFVVRSEEEKQDLSRKWKTIENWVALFQIAILLGFLLRGIFDLPVSICILPVVPLFLAYLILLRRRFRTEYSVHRNLSQRLHILEYNRQTAQSNSLRNLAMTWLPFSLITFVFWNLLPTNELDILTCTAVLTLATTHYTLLLVLKLTPNRRQPKNP